MQEPNRSRRVCIRRGKKNSICGQTHRQTQRVAPLWQFKSLIWGISSGFPLASHFDLPGSAYIFVISQSLSMHAHTFLSQDGFHSRGLQVLSISSHHSPFDLQGGFLCLRSQTGLLTWRIRNAWSLIFYLGKGQLPLSVVLLSIFWSFSPQDTNRHFTLGELTHTENLLCGRHCSRNIQVHFIGEETKCVNNFRKITQLVRIQIPGVWPQILNDLSTQTQNLDSRRTRSACAAFCRPAVHAH